MKIKRRLKPNNIYHGDCLELMKYIPSNSIDMVLADPPYGTTACKWDSIIPLKPMWKQLKRIIKSNSAIVITASQPFTSILVSSNIKMFKYCWVWNKHFASNSQLAKIQPLKIHEDIIVFGNRRLKYNPQGVICCNIKKQTTIEVRVLGIFVVNRKGNILLKKKPDIQNLFRILHQCVLGKYTQHKNQYP